MSIRTGVVYAIELFELPNDIPMAVTSLEMSSASSSTLILCATVWRCAGLIKLAQRCGIVISMLRLFKLRTNIFCIGSSSAQIKFSTVSARSAVHPERQSQQE